MAPRKFPLDLVRLVQHERSRPESCFFFLIMFGTYSCEGAQVKGGDTARSLAGFAGSCLGAGSASVCLEYSLKSIAVALNHMDTKKSSKDNECLND